MMRYSFLVDTYKTEIEKVLSVWAMFDDDDLHPRDFLPRYPFGLHHN